jgi:Zinc finger C-x8-C-x5-C-x3-H type (and similar)
MSIPSSFSSQRNTTVRETAESSGDTTPDTASGTSNRSVTLEDCRDYLRTGRCKYGASCKYRHPPNVQSGGGIKGPIDPFEPLYPIRPNEPVCQYFMKHGTCKFGQACKFHHPPNLAGIGGANLHHNIQPQYQPHHVATLGTSHQVGNGNTVLVSMPIATNSANTIDNHGREGSSAWIASGGTDRSASGVQILPQRPTEPNCIYFLKNGRCKYGATCRYHHPVNYHSDRSSNRGVGGTGSSGGGRGMYTPQQDTGNVVATPQVHYVAQLPPGATMQQGHIVVAGGKVTFVALDGTTVPAHIVSVAQAANGSGTMASSTASSSSIASSFETAISNSADNQDSTSSLWTTPTNNTRRGNAGMAATGRSSNQAVLSASSNGQMNRTVYVHNVGDASSLGLPRVVSTSSTIASDPVFYESAGPSPSAWRGSRSASFDHTRHRTSTLQGGDDCLHKSISVHSALDEHAAQRAVGNGPQHQYSPNVNGRPPPGIRSPRRQSGHVDEGLSMMTSALLTMLDTPTVDAFDENVEYGLEEQAQALTPRMGTRYPASSSRPGPPQNNGLSLNPQAQSYQLPPVADVATHRPQHQQDHRRHQPPSYDGGQTTSDVSLGYLSTNNSLESFASVTGDLHPSGVQSIGYDSSYGWISQGNNNENDDSSQLPSSQNVGLYLP